jgi:hypothetical protein
MSSPFPSVVMVGEGRTSTSWPAWMWVSPDYCCDVPSTRALAPLPRRKVAQNAQLGAGKLVDGRPGPTMTA